MQKYIVKRSFHTVLVLFALVTILFFLFRLMPSNPTGIYVSEGMSLEQRQQMLQRWGLTKPLHEQYIVYLRNMVTFSFGESFHYQQSVMTILWIRLQNTLVLMIPSVTVGTCIGTVLGVLYGRYRGTIGEKTGLVASLIALSVPIFFSAVILTGIFTFTLNWLPPGRMTSPATFYEPRWHVYFTMDFLKHAVLPFLTATIYYTGTPALIMRTGMLEVMNKQFMTTYQMWGIPERLRLRHAAKNAFPPLLNYFPILIGYMFGGQVVLETVYSWPGVGALMIDAVLNQDYPILQTSFFIMGLMVILMNFVVDIVHAYIDPRVSYEGES